MTFPSLTFPICKMGTLMPKEVALCGEKGPGLQKPGLETLALPGSLEKSEHILRPQGPHPYGGANDSILPSGSLSIECP